MKVTKMKGPTTGVGGVRKAATRGDKTGKDKEQEKSEKTKLSADKIRDKHSWTVHEATHSTCKVAGWMHGVMLERPDGPGNGSQSAGASGVHSFKHALQIERTTQHGHLTIVIATCVYRCLLEITKTVNANK